MWPFQVHLHQVKVNMGVMATADYRIFSGDGVSPPDTI